MKFRFPTLSLHKASAHLSTMQALSSPSAIPPSPHRSFPIPHVYTPSPPHWVPLAAASAPSSAALPARGTLLRIISWNIDFSIPSHGDRTTTALSYLASLFSQPANATPAPMILMLQEMSAESHAAILAHPWIRENFIVSDKKPLPQWYFTLLLVDRRLATGEWFRVAFQGSRYKRDVLGVDVLVGEGDAEARGEGAERAEGKKVKCLRFCTTHLESLAETPGFELRPKQLAVISSLLKEQAEGIEIVGGLVGGDMNAISALDSEIHKRPDVGLRDVWEDNIQSHGPPAAVGTEITVGEKDATFGRAGGHTWGYQARGRWPPIRFDKFFHTEDLEVVALDETQDSSGKVGRLGIDVKTEKGMWISDHFGIAVGVKVP
jgi:tyrosyl-DNA phosphodiesterase 2